MDLPHTDYFVDTDRFYRYHVDHGMDHPKNKQIYRARFGEIDTEKDEAKVILGLWKPVKMNTPVCDVPFAVMDGSTFDRKDERGYGLHIDLRPFVRFHMLMGSPVYRPQHIWYYYSFMTTEEVLVMHQWRKDSFHGGYASNFHGAFLNPHPCPSDEFEPRLSVEIRVVVFFPRNESSTK